MSRPECYLSLELEQRMNLQVRILTLQDYHRYGEAIDASDDDRREKAFGLDKWNEDMMTYFLKVLDIAIEDEDWDLIKQTRKEIEEFKQKYFEKRKELQELELYYEDLDDKLREWILEYLATCLEKTRNESSKIDLQMIKENLEKKRARK